VLFDLCDFLFPLALAAWFWRWEVLVALHGYAALPLFVWYITLHHGLAISVIWQWHTFVDRRHVW
jgi:hypothetical protein